MCVRPYRPHILSLSSVSILSLNLSPLAFLFSLPRLSSGFIAYGLCALSSLYLSHTLSVSSSLRIIALPRFTSPCLASSHLASPCLTLPPPSIASSQEIEIGPLIGPVGESRRSNAGRLLGCICCLRFIVGDDFLSSCRPCPCRLRLYYLRRSRLPCRLRLLHSLALRLRPVVRPRL